MNSFVRIVLVALALATSLMLAQTTTSLAGYCDTVSNPGVQFVLDGLGQTLTNNCTFGPGTPTPSTLLGALIKQNGTIEDLYVKQFPLNGANMGGSITIWVNPKTGTLPFSTAITCTLGPSSNGLYQCHNTANGYTVVPGDRVIAVVSPPGGSSISPVTATLDLATTTTVLSPLSGYCGSNSFGTAFVLYGLGQTSNSNCVYGPGSPVQAWLGQVITKTGTLKNLYVKQQQLNSSGMGGTVNVWVNPKTGSSPIQTAIACTVVPNGSLYTCSNTFATYSVVTGDQVIVIVTPANAGSPFTATVDVQ